MDDDLMRLFGGSNIKNFMSRLGMEEGEPIYHPWLSKNIEKAQKKVEERNFEIRKHLLEYDDVLNQQRKFIYEQRDAILSDDNLIERINNTTEEMIQAALDEYKLSSKKDPIKAQSEFAEYIMNTFASQIGIDLESKEYQNLDEAANVLAGKLKTELEEKKNLVGAENLNTFIRFQYIQSIDKKWLDHLEGMEALREAVYLRSYAQKNPLTEYKLEGFQIFDKMIDKIREDIASLIHRVRVGQNENREVRTNKNAAMSANHGSMNAFSAHGSAVAAQAQRQAQRSATANASQPHSVTVVRSQPKVGRNDPCPCGSGKKYKQCHGA
jgi:preprotein translocase subunit SecA